MIVVGKCHRIDDCAGDANIIKDERRFCSKDPGFEAGKFSRMGGTARERGFEWSGTGRVEAVNDSGVASRIPLISAEISQLGNEIRR